MGEMRSENWKEKRSRTRNFRIADNGR